MFPAGRHRLAAAFSLAAHDDAGRCAWKCFGVRASTDLAVSMGDAWHPDAAGKGGATDGEEDGEGEGTLLKKASPKPAGAARPLSPRSLGLWEAVCSVRWLG